MLRSIHTARTQDLSHEQNKGDQTQPCDVVVGREHFFGRISAVAGDVLTASGVVIKGHLRSEWLVLGDR